MLRVIKYIPIIALLLLGACNTNSGPGEVMGYAPVYADSSTIKIIQFESARPTENAGKIYYYKGFTFQVETGKGIHIINSLVPENASKIGFITVYGCSEISIKNDVLYTNNMSDLVSINISDITHPVPTSRVQQVFPGVSQTSPPHQGVYFECVDPNLGTVIGWTEKLLVNPKCKR
ncbi:MAG: hypothetical protein JNM95_11965 [Chitinophagaceae bacterium]|nr:hypothetical protein [Chitinophagaceae bacterium]